MLDVIFTTKSKLCSIHGESEKELYGITLIGDLDKHFICKECLGNQLRKLTDIELRETELLEFMRKQKDWRIRSGQHVGFG